MTSNRRRLAAKRKTISSGSSPLHGGKLEFIVVAKLRRPHGLKGEALVTVLTDFPDRIAQGTSFFLGEDHFPISVTNSRSHNEGLLLSFKEFPDRKSLEGRQNQFIYAPIQDIPQLKKGEYYHHQLIGLHVVDIKGRSHGELVDILVTGANDVYVVRPDEGRDLLLPAINDVIIEIDLDTNKMVIKLIPGLLDL